MFGVDLKEWGNLDLNQGPTGYEGGRTPTYPISSNRFQYNVKLLDHKKLLDLIES